MDVETDTPPSKKHKKHKKHKHKKSKHHEEDEVLDVGGIAIPADQEMPKPAIKLRLKIGGHTLTKSVTKSALENVSPPKAGQAMGEAEGEEEGEEEEEEEEDEELIVDSVAGKEGSSWEVGSGEVDPSDVYKTKKKDEDTSDEEQAWLDALEKGELDDNGEVKKARDESLLTARQRSLLHGGKQDSLLELPSGYKSAELTEEQIKRQQQRTLKRREQAREKREKDKKQTLDRLLKKQDTKGKGSKGKGTKRSHVTGFRYLKNRHGITVSISAGFQMPFTAKVTPKPPAKVQCGLRGCPNFKKYACAKTGVALCSLRCYQKNLKLHGLSHTSKTDV